MFHKPNIDALKQVVLDIREGSNSGPRRRYYKIENGTTKVLVCPPYNNRGVISKIAYFHYSVPGQNGKLTMMMDPARTLQRDDVPSPISKVVSVLAQAGKEEAKQWAPKGRGMLNVIPLEFNGEPVDRSKFPYLPHIMEGPASLHSFISGKCIDPDFVSDNGFFTFANPEGQQTPFKVERTGKAINTEYTFSFTPKTLALSTSEEILEGIQKEIYDLDVIYGSWSQKMHDRSVEIANRILVQVGAEPMDPSWYGKVPEDLLKAKPGAEDDETGKD